MTAKQLTYLLLITTLTFGCTRYWIRTVNSEQIIWEKIYYNQNNNSHEVLSNNCTLFARIKSTIKGKFNDFNFYEFDSIRIYVRHTDTILNKLIQMGFIQGQYFFSPITANICQPRLWINPIKSDHNNWFGYNFYVTGLSELKTVEIPKQIRDKIELYKVFRISFEYIGQPYVNPEVFKFELINENYKCNQDTISFENFIDKAITKKFYQNGFEL